MDRGNVDRLLRQAIADKQVVSFSLKGCQRIAEPHDYGIIRGEPKLLFYQVGGASRRGRGFGWRWARIDEMADLACLPRRFAGTRAAPSGRHARWDEIFASVTRRER